MAATKTRTRSAPAEDERPPLAPAEATDAERADWLDVLPADLDWLDDARTRHRELAIEWAKQIEGIFALRSRHTDAARAYRAEVRAAVEVGDAPPPKPPEIDTARLDAEVEVAFDDAADARDALDFAAIEVLDLLREHRVDVALDSLPPSLLRALVAGGANQAAIAAEQARSEYKFLTEPRIETHIEPNGPTPDLGSTEIIHTGAAA